MNIILYIFAGEYHLVAKKSLLCIVIIDFLEEILSFTYKSVKKCIPTPGRQKS